MSAAEMMERIAEASSRLKARTAGVFWLMVFLAGSLALFLGRGVVFSAANIVAPLCYIVVTLLLYDLLKPVNRSVSLLAAFFGLVGCGVSLFHLTRFIHLRDLVFFGLHCLLIGYLIFRSTFLPRILGVLMAFAGLGWLTFLYPPLAKTRRSFRGIARVSPAAPVSRPHLIPRRIQFYFSHREKRI